MENFTSEKIGKILKASKVVPQKQWREKMLAKIRSLEDNNHNKYILFFNPFIMKRLISGVVAVLVVAVTFGFVYTTNTPYAQAMKHLRNASSALEQLKNPSANTQVSFLPTAYAEETASSETTQLIQTVETETDAAIAASEEISDAEDLDEVLGAVNEVQGDTVDTLSTLIASTDDDDVIQAASTTIENTDASNEVVGDAINATTEAVSADKPVERVKLSEEIKARREARRAERIQKGEEVLQDLKANYDQMDEAMKKKYDTIQQILTDCETNTNPEVKCNLGKAKGLAVALRVRAINEVRHEEIKQKMEELKDLRELRRQEIEALKEENEALRKLRRQEMEAQKKEDEALRERRIQEMEAQKEEDEALRERRIQEMEAQKEEDEALRERRRQEMETQKEAIEALREKNKQEMEAQKEAMKELREKNKQEMEAQKEAMKELKGKNEENPMNQVNPMNPMNPGNPGNPPVNPMNQGNPMNPVNPVNPGNPGNPMNPGNPVNPVNPANQPANPQ